MAQVKSKVKGEYTYPSDFSEIPDGALQSALNAVIDRESVVEPRRGFENFHTIGSGSSRISEFLFFQTYRFAHYGPAGAPDTLAYSTGSTFTDLSGSFLRPNHAPFTPELKAIEANLNFYITTRTGTKKIDTIANGLTAAGAPAGLDVQLALTGASGFFTNNTQVGYRMLWGKKDANNNLVRGAPSQRYVISNTSGGLQNVIVTTSVPSTVDATWFYQVYRTPISLDQNTDPGDEEGLVFEGNPTSTDLSNKYVTFTDSTPDSLRGATIYTAASQDGISQANYEPPVACDIANFRGYTLYSNTLQKQGLTITLLGVGGSSGINSVSITGDTTNGSKTIINVSSFTGVALNQVVSGTGVVASQSISAMQTTNDAYTNCHVSTGSPIITNISSTANFVVGQKITNANFTAGTKIISVDGPTQVTVDHNSSGTSTTESITFGNYIFLSANATATNATVALTSSDTITIDGVTYTAGASEDVANHIFKVDSSGTPAANIASTAGSLVKVINRNPSASNIYAFYTSGITDLPGKILLQTRAFSASSFAATGHGHQGSAWSPSLPTSGTTISSTADSKRNRMHVSKIQQPEACPLTQYFDVGSADQDIYRAVPIRNAVILVKSDGYYVMTGTTPQNFTVDPLDLTTICVSPETIRALNNQVYALTNQGIATASDTGVGIISRPIEDQLIEYMNGQNNALLARATAYESDRKYILAVYAENSSTHLDKEIIFNTFTNQFTHWDRAISSLGVCPDDKKLYIGIQGSNKISLERKTLDDTDYADETYTASLVSQSGLNCVLTDASGVSVGDAVTTNGFSLVSAIDLPSNTITLLYSVDLSASVGGSINLVKAYTTSVLFTSNYMGNPGIMKHVREVHPMFKQNSFNTAQMSFQTDIAPAASSVTFVGQNIGAIWGYSPWGTFRWGGSNDASKDRTYVPAEHQRCNWLNVGFSRTEAFGKFGLAGLEYTFEPMSERTNV